MTPDRSMKMYVTLKYGDNHEIILNPNCATKNLLNFIKEKCRCEKDAILDLCDEGGNPKNLHEHTAMISALCSLQDKTTYVPVVLQKNDESVVTHYEPILDANNKLYLAISKGLQKHLDKIHSNKFGSSSDTPSGKGQTSRSRRERAEVAAADRDDDGKRSPVQGRKSRRR